MSEGFFELPIYQVDAFASDIFSGNPAAVVPLKAWLPDSMMMAIAAENNLSETAFFVMEEKGYSLRWFTPSAEVDLCGHATLATAHVLFSELGFKQESIAFETRSGKLVVRRNGDGYEMDFPASQTTEVCLNDAVTEALGAAPVSLRDGTYGMAIYDNAEQVAALTPNFDAVSKLPWWGVIATAPGRDCDFVSRFFAPAKSIPEDPVTGSAHCLLAPYWSERLGKTKLLARQISKRGGEIGCAVRGDRVELSGRAALYMTGTIRLPKETME